MSQVRALLGSKGSSVITIAPSQTLEEAVAVLSEHRIGAIVVSADGRAVDGVLSERDVIRRLCDEGAGCLALLVGDVMTAAVTTCGPDATTDELMRLMTDGRFRHVPVVDDGALVGIVSIGDVVKVRMAELEVEKSHLEEYVTGTGY